MATNARAPFWLGKLTKLNPNQARPGPACRGKAPHKQRAHWIFDCSVRSMTAGTVRWRSQNARYTAQPFQPTRTAKRFLHDGWTRNVCSKTKMALSEICNEFATVTGTASVADANNVVETVQEMDLVFIDPPYSGVHYSRFYHVLETIARGKCGAVSGIGRYPPPEERPRSKYSVGSESREAISDLLKKVAERGGTAIVTFPDKKCSNGISGNILERIAEDHFSKVTRKVVRGRFSTLGGNGKHREARQPSSELVLLLKP